MAKRNIDGEKQEYRVKKPGLEEVAPEFLTYGEKREALKDLYRQSQKQKEEQ